MRGLLIQTDREPVIIDIERDEHGSTLDALQKLVGGNIEVFSPLFGEGIDLYVNEDGLATCPPNRAVYATKAMEEEGYLSQMDFSHVAKEGELYTVLFGDIVAVGYDLETGENRSLTDEEVGEVSGYFTKVSGPGSGLMEALAILQGAYRDDRDRTPEGRASLRETAQEARNAADRLGDEHRPDMPERGGDER